MKRILLVLVAVVGLCSSCSKISAQAVVNWTDIETAQEQIKVKANKGKIIFVDCYTDWCGWCKVMDNKTFSDETIVKLMNYYFINVKFNAEQKGDVTFDNKVYHYQAYGRGGANQLAGVLLQNKLAFPSFALLNSDLSSKTVLQGYIEKSEFEPMIVYYGESYDKLMDYEAFKAKYSSEIRPTIIEKISKSK
jgi:thioredoxin-related protein